MPKSKPAVDTHFAPAGRADRASIQELARFCIENPVAQMLLDSLSGHALILNEQRQAMVANTEMLGALGLENSLDAYGLRLGELMHCIQVCHGPDGCGTSEACSHCGAIQTILAAQTSRKPATGECLITTEHKGVRKSGEFKVRCTPIQLDGHDLYALVLQDISGQKRREALEHIFFHDVLNLVGGLDGLARLLQEEPQHVQRTARQIRDLTAQLSQEVLSQRILLSAEDGTLAAEPQTIFTAKVLDELRTIFLHHEVAKGRTFEIKPGPEDIFRTDEILLGRVLVNMVKNAFEATPLGGTVSVWHERDGEFRRFVVQNPGVIPSNVTPHIFQRSFSTKARKGRGLGTYGMKLLGEHYLKGRVGFTSRPEDGTRFFIELPLEDDSSNSVPIQGSGRIEAIPEDKPEIFTPETSPPGARNILVVDDSHIVRQLLATVLSKEHRVLLAENGDKALEIARTELPDLIVMDAMMPGLDGYAVCARIKSDPALEEIPVIFLTALNDEKDETLALEAGAIDFITKPINALTVAARVRNHLELKRMRDHLRSLTLLDGLTGIPNRRRFENQLAQEWQRMGRNGQFLSLIMGDVDYFKLYNDTYGHVRGDECLRKVAQAFTKALRRPGDLAARYGGEEFVCILPETDEAGAMAVAQQIQTQVATLALPHSSSKAAPIVTVSLGVASMQPTLGESPQNLLEEADRNLYRAKRNGRNRIVG